MATTPIRDPKADFLLTPENAALLIVDVQPLQIGSVASMDRRALVENIASLAKIAKLYRLPTVVSTINVKNRNSAPTVHQVMEALGDVPQIDRTTLNAWEDPAFVSAVKATGRKKLIMSAVWTEVCLAFPALDALRDGFEVFPVVDACGSTSLEAHTAGLDRIMRAGGQPSGWVGVICELQRDWARVETVEKFADILFAVEGR
jgi:nicotinamidase-related amidase